MTKDFSEKEELETGWPSENLHPALRHIDDFCVGEMTRTPLVEGLIYFDTLCSMYGPSGAGKTFAAIDLSLHVATGKPYRGLHVDESCGEAAVAYVIGESEPGVRDRVNAWCDYHKVNRAKIGFYPWRTQISPLNLFDTDSVDEFISGLVERNPYWNLIVIDTLARCFGDGDENRTADMNVVVRSLDRIMAKTGACVLVVHHTSKSDTHKMRGSNALKGALDTEIKITPREDGFLMSCTKQRDGEPFKALRSKIEPHSGVFRRDEYQSAVAVPYSNSSVELPPLGRITGNQGIALQAIKKLWRELGQPEQCSFSVSDFNKSMIAIKPSIAKSSSSTALKWAVSAQVLRRPSQSQLEIGPAFEGGS